MMKPTFFLVPTFFSRVPSKMRIAVEGCTHGELENIYETIKKLEETSGKKVDLLVCCGDFQAMRNLADLKCMACPDKYKEMCSFYKYYSGEKKPHVPTVFIGGNHEASNYLQELPFGGWVAPDIFYLGYAGVISVSGKVRIAGLSGIFAGYDYLRGRFERTPYGPDDMRSAYHVRNLEVFRLKQLSEHPPDVVLTHDWPRGVYNHGDVGKLLSMKMFLRKDIERDQLGSRPAQEIMEVLRPRYWFSAHLHVKFPALVEHPDGTETKFLSLDKCLPRRRFLQVLEIGEELEDGEPVRFEFDPQWLAILRSTDHLMSVKPQATNHMPGPNCGERWDFRPTEEEVKEAMDAMGGDLTVPASFRKTVRPFDPATESVRDLSRVGQPLPRRNDQTVELCKRLGIRDPMDVVLRGKWPEIVPEEEEEKEGDPEEAALTASGTDEIELPENSDDEEESAGNQSEAKDTAEGVGSAAGGEGFVVDASPSMENLSKSWENVPEKKLKRRNQAIYEEKQEDD